MTLTTAQYSILLDTVKELRILENEETDSMNLTRFFKLRTRITQMMEPSWADVKDLLWYIAGSPHVVPHDRELVSQYLMWHEAEHGQ